MRYAIIESGGKQYKAVEGRTIEVDRLSDEKGAQVDLKALLMADGEEVMVGTPTVAGIQVKTTVVDHIRGEKVTRFKYSPKKRIRVRGGHRQQYTQLIVDFIGKPGEVRKIEVEEPEPVVEAEEKRPRAEPKALPEKPAEPPAQKAPAKKAEKAPATSSSKEKKAQKAPAKKTAEKKSATAKKSSK